MTQPFDPTMKIGHQIAEPIMLMPRWTPEGSLVALQLMKDVGIP